MDAFSQFKDGRTEVPARFNGPPTSGNGGWAAGAFAETAGARPGGPPVEVTLRVPVPLDAELTVSDGAVRHGETLVASLAWPDVPPAAVDPVGPGEARAAAGTYPGFAAHPFPTCYVCGPDRPDGLRIFPGRLPDGRTAAPWTVRQDADLATVWAALDCPGGWAVLDADHPYLLGRITATVTELPKSGTDCVVVGVVRERSGRKAMVTSTLYGPDGARLASAGATWIAVA